MHVFGKTLCYGLERVTGNLHSKFDEHRMSFMLRMQLAVLRACLVLLTVVNIITFEFLLWVGITLSSEAFKWCFNL